MRGAQNKRPQPRYGLEEHMKFEARRASVGEICTELIIITVSVSLQGSKKGVWGRLPETVGSRWG